MPGQSTPPQSADIWPLHDAKARFSEIVRRAVEQGPQHVSVRGEPAVVVISEKTSRSLPPRVRRSSIRCWMALFGPTIWSKRSMLAPKTPTVTSISDVSC